MQKNAEPFLALLRAFPESRLFAFEADEALCERLNRDAAPGVEFHASVLGRANEARTFHATVHPMCASLYEPDERWPDLFGNLDFMRKTRSGTLDVSTLERFATARGVTSIDFLKLDIQGAELDVLEGANRFLDSVVCIVCEVEFVPLYRDQPLFGDVDAFLRSRGFLFHKFLGMFGRSMKPLVANNDANYPIQMMWSDAIFVRDLRMTEKLADEQLLKLAVFMEMYGSVDVSHYLLSKFDSRRRTSIASEFSERLNRQAG